MATVTVEAWPWLSELFGGGRNSRYVFQVEIGDETTLETLLRQLAEGNSRLQQAMYESDGVEFSGYLSAVVNGRLTELMEGYKTKLRDGDRVVLVQGYAGGCGAFSRRTT